MTVVGGSWVDDLSGTEVRQRLERRGLDPAVAAVWVERRERSPWRMWIIDSLEGR